jgi:hypothetical protein
MECLNLFWITGVIAIGITVIITLVMYLFVKAKQKTCYK